MRPTHATGFLLALVTLAAAAPAATAQLGLSHETFAVLPFSDPPALKPEVGLAILHLMWTYNLNSHTGHATQHLDSFTLNWLQPTCDHPGILFTGPQSQPVEFPSSPRLDTSTTGYTVFQVAATRDAPGERPIQCILEGYVVRQGALGSSQSNLASWTVLVLVKYDGTVLVQAPQTLATVGPGKTAAFPIQLHNEANAASSVTFRLLDDAPRGWTAILPAPIVLGAPRDGNSDATVLFTVRAPDDGGRAAFRVEVTPSSARDPSQQAPPTTLTFVVHSGDRAGDDAQGNQTSQGDAPRGKLAPDAGPLLAIGLLGIAAVVRRRT